MMVFHEIYGIYYQTVASILDRAVAGELTPERMEQIVREKAFSDSVLTILPALWNQQWQLLLPDCTTPLKHRPAMPLTTLELRWLKAISLDPRFRLFGVDLPGLEEVEPLFTREDFCFFDQYGDGDPYTDAGYIRNFRTVLEALRREVPLRVRYRNGQDRLQTLRAMPVQLEYSEKDDKFRLIVVRNRMRSMLNLSRMADCQLMENWLNRSAPRKAGKRERLVLELTDQRNALERALLHFAHFEKRAERLTGDQYRITIFTAGKMKQSW